MLNCGKTWTSRWLAASGLVLLAWLAPGAGQVASAQTVTTCHPAEQKGADGPVDYGAYCWIDFSSLDLSDAKSGSGQPFRVDLRGGAYLTFTLRIQSHNTAGNIMDSVGVPSWSGAAFGNSAFNTIPGEPILYQDRNNQNQPRNTVVLSSITLNDNGATELPFVFVAADGESSNQNETLSFTTTGDPWALVAAPGISNPARTMPTLSPATTVGNSTGSQTVNITGVGSGNTSSYVFTTNNSPGTVTAVLEGGGLQGVLFGLKYHTIGLSLTKTPVGEFRAGGTGSYTINVANTVTYPAVNPPSEPQPVRVVDTLPDGLTYASASGSGWTCSNAGQVVTCDRTVFEDLTTSKTFPPITIGVNIASDAPAVVVNQAEVFDPTTTTLVFNVCEVEDNGVCPNSATSSTGAETEVLKPDLSTSTKLVDDLNGGDVAPGDTLRYSIVLTESAGAMATDVSVTDPLPMNTTGLTVISVPPGSSDASNASQLSVSGITVPANGSATIVFDVTVGSVGAGATIDNTATITNPAGPGANPVAETKVVLESQIIEPGAGNKILYLYDNRSLSRTRTAASNTSGVVVESGSNPTDWTLSPVLAGQLEFTKPGSITVSLPSSAHCNAGWLCFLVPNPSASVTVQLLQDETVVGTSTAQTISGTSVATRAFSIPLTGTAPLVFSPEEPLVLRVRSTSSNSDIRVYQYNGGRAMVAFHTPTVINVDGVGIYSEPHPSTATKSRYVQGDTFYIRAIVSDPFGHADITRAELTLSDGGGTPLRQGESMGVVAASGATKTFETAHTIAANPRIGSWTARVLAVEGTEVTPTGEPEISHEGLVHASVHGLLTLGKEWEGGANAGDTVSLTIAGGSSTEAGTSTAPSPGTDATATAVAGASLALAETFSSGSAGNYTATLSCVRDLDDDPVTVTGTGLSRTITMPADSAVTCKWVNAKTVPLTLVKVSTVVSDPVNGAVNPKAIPGAVVEYQIVIANPATNPVDADTVVVTDSVPAHTVLRVADMPTGPGPVSFTDGIPPSGLTYGFVSLGSGSDDIEFSNDGGATWNHTPTPDADGYDATVDAIRINPKGVLDATPALGAPAPTFTLKFRVRIE